jgi:hypothetical protein
VCTEPPEAACAGTSADTATFAENEPDLSTLNAQSDYTPFLREGVRTEVRSAALRKLWSSDPIFSLTDGLQDYAGDFTDSATIPSEPIATAYKIGWGIAGRAAGQEHPPHPAEPEQSSGGHSNAGEADPNLAQAAEPSHGGDAPPTDVGGPEA